jgi:hypothetical protein
MLIALASLLIGLHLLGVTIGVAGITFAEIFYLKATADGRIDAREKEYIRSTFWALKWGMFIVLISGSLLILVEYQLPFMNQAVLFAPLWVQETLCLVIITSGWALVKKKVSWFVGTALAFSAWWMILILDAWHNVPLGYSSLIILYALFASLSAIILGYVRVVCNKELHHKASHSK